MSQDPHPFLRMQIFNFQVNNHQSIHLSDINTQIEIKEKHRSTRDNIESNLIKNRKLQNQNLFFFFVNFRTSKNEISIVY